MPSGRSQSSVKELVNALVAVTIDVPVAIRGDLRAGVPRNFLTVNVALSSNNILPARRRSKSLDSSKDVIGIGAGTAHSAPPFRAATWAAMRAISQAVNLGWSMILPQTVAYGLRGS
jgi:hypothetical protein